MKKNKNKNKEDSAFFPTKGFLHIRESFVHDKLQSANTKWHILDLNQVKFVPYPSLFLDLACFPTWSANKKREQGAPFTILCSNHQIFIEGKKTKQNNLHHFDRFLLLSNSA